MSTRKTYDTDVITLRRIFANDPLTNTPISSGYILAVGSNGTTTFMNPLEVPAINTLSTTVGTGGGGGSGDVTKNNLVSTVIGLGTSGYISTTQLLSTSQGLQTQFNEAIDSSELTSSLIGLGTLGYLSSFSSIRNSFSTNLLFTGNAQLVDVNFVDKANGNIFPLNSSNSALYFNGSLVGSGTVINNFNTSTYIYQISSVSTVITQGVTFISTATNVILSNASSLSISTGNLFTSSINFIDTLLNTVQNLAVNNGVLQLNGAPIQGGGNANQQSSLVSTFFLDTSLTSTVVGLGAAGYISSSQLLSTSFGLQQFINSFIDQNELTSTVIGLGTAGFTSSLDLQNTLTSSIVGLGTAGYISSSLFNTSLTSSIVGLGTAGYISSQSLLSSIAEWSQYTASSPVIIANTSRIKATASLYLEASNSIVLQSPSDTSVIINDVNNTPGTLEVGSLGLRTSTADLQYSLTILPEFQGNVSSLSLFYYNGTYLTAGSLYLSSLYFGNISSGGTFYNGQLTTDSTATNIYWKGTQLNGGGGGGISPTQLQSTVLGLSTNYIGGNATFSSIYTNYKSSITNTANVLNFSSLFVNNVPILFDSNGNLYLTSQTL